MIDFKIVKGGFYRTRDGRKVECLKDDLDHDVYPLAITDGTDLWTCTIFGSAYGDQSDIDIVGVWEEPKPKRLCYKNGNLGTLCMLTDSEVVAHPFTGSLERYPCSLDES